MPKSYLSMKQLTELLEIHGSTIKGYMDKHPEFIKFDKVQNRYRIHVSAVETLKTIRRLYSEGLKREDVDEYLRSSGVPITIAVDEKKGTGLISLNKEVQELKNMFNVQQDNMLQMQMQFNQKIVRQIEQEKKELKEAFHQEIGELKHLVNLHESERISELRLSLEEAAASVEVNKEELVADRKISLWQKLFGRSRLTKASM